MPGCLSGENGGNVCPARSDEVYCGYCSADRMATGNPNGGACRYCPAGYQCSYSDICGDLKCHPGAGAPGGESSGSGSSAGTTARTYYASCSQCTVGPYGMYSYRGGSYGVCNGYYQACVQARCGKILDNCR